MDRGHKGDEGVGMKPLIKPPEPQIRLTCKKRKGQPRVHILVCLGCPKKARCTSWREHLAKGDSDHELLRQAE